VFAKDGGSGVSWNVQGRLDDSSKEYTMSRSHPPFLLVPVALAAGLSSWAILQTEAAPDRMVRVGGLR
jgi:hypothetical protein